MTPVALIFVTASTVGKTLCAKERIFVVVGIRRTASIALLLIPRYQKMFLFHIILLTGNEKIYTSGRCNLTEKHE